MVAEALDSLTSQAVKPCRGTRKRCVEAPNSSVTRMRSEIWSFVIDGIPTNAKDFEECTSYLTHPSPTPRNAASHWTQSLHDSCPSFFVLIFQVLLATVSANDMKYLFGALLDILVIWLLYPSLLIVIFTTPHCFSCFVSDFCRLFYSFLTSKTMEGLFLTTL